MGYGKRRFSGGKSPHDINKLKILPRDEQEKEKKFKHTLRDIRSTMKQLKDVLEQRDNECR